MCFLFTFQNKQKKPNISIEKHMYSIRQMLSTFYPDIANRCHYAYLQSC